MRFLTGHLRNGELNLDWENLTSPNQTLVFYMGLASLPIICQQLIAAGVEPSRQVAIIEKGTTASQKVICSDILTIDEKAKQHNFTNPSMIIVGNIVELHESLQWFRGDSQSKNIFPIQS